MTNQRSKTVIIIGAGPAGLTAAYELLKKSSHIKPIVYEASSYLGGLSRTVNYKGNRMDIGGHRFFSKSEKVLEWWQQILPLEKTLSSGPKITINYHNKSKEIPLVQGGVDPTQTDKVMLLRNRYSRIFFAGQFFDYPVELNFHTMRSLGLIRMVKIGFSYLYARIFPRKEHSLEDFFINRFGQELYETFFKDYTEKVWGTPCSKIAAQWGAQRVKGLSVSKIFTHMFKQIFSSKVTAKTGETSLIQKFLYPKLGPGQMWEEVASVVQAEGGEVYLEHQAVGLVMEGKRITGVKIKNVHTGEIQIQKGDYVLSTMPIKELIACFEPDAPLEVLEVAQGLQYRDFVTVGLLVKKLKLEKIVFDNWIYIQEKGVKIGRLQIYNNWSPYLVKDPSTTWLGLEYFCNEEDELWRKEDSAFIQFAAQELAQIGMINKEDVIEGTVVRMLKAYPAYTGSYDRLQVIKDFTDPIENLFLIGRNGMHKYNNQDHSMLSAMKAVENILANKPQKDNIWSVNVESEYQEPS
jgi:protoporphyrinogen oxidase